MRFQLISAIALVALFVSSVNCGCDRSGEEKPASDDGEGTQFFKNLGCDIKKGAEKFSDSAKPYIEDIKKGAERVSESAKPYIDDIGSRAKKLGGIVVDRFNDLKERISGSSDNATEIPDIFSKYPAEVNPIADTDDGSSPSTESPSSDPKSPVSSSSDLPNIDDRILLDIDEQRCPENTKNDGRGHCRNIG